jgi:colanic acid/amylovoran biosynthesis glycosyltransferase
VKIAVFQNSCPAPSEIFVYNQVAALKALGHDLQLFGYRNKRTSAALRLWFTREIAVPIRHPYRIIPFRPLRYALGVFLAHASSLPHSYIKKLKDEKLFGWWASSSHLLYWACLLQNIGYLDVVHAHFAPVGGLVAMLKECNIVRAPLVVSLHGADITASDSKQHITSGLYPWLWKHASAYTYNSSYIRSRAIKLGFPETRMHHLPVAIGSVFESIEPKQTKRAFRVLSVGRMVEKKGHATGLRAFAEFHKNFPRSEYVIVGDGPLRQKTEDLVRSLGLSNVVRITGFMTQDQIKETMLTSDVFLFPSETASNGDMEGQGLVVQEAQACRLPVLVTRHNGVPDGMLDGKTGWIVEEKDFQAMAIKLEALAKNPARRMRMGDEARKFVLENYRSSTLAKRLELILEEASNDRQ